jgi:circadian clock protein KaiB
MPRKTFELKSDRFDKAAPLRSRNQRYVLRLYITGASTRSMRAIRNIKAICEKYLHGRYVLDIIDVYQQPSLARVEQIIAAPTLIKTLPNPLRRFIGDMSRTDHILLGLDLESDHSNNDEDKNDHAAPFGID